MALGIGPQSKATLITFRVIPPPVNVRVPIVDNEYDIAIAQDNSNAAKLQMAERNVQIYTVQFKIRDIEAMNYDNKPIQVVTIGDIMYSEGQRTYIRLVNIGHRMQSELAVDKTISFSAENANSPFLMAGLEDPFGVVR